MAPTQWLNREDRLTYIRSPVLITLAFGLSFTSRLIESAGFPSFVNFLHFAIVPLVLLISITSTKSHDSYQLNIASQIIIGLFLLLIFTFASAALNSAGIINAILSYILLAEPFLLILSLIYLPLSLTSFNFMKTWFIRLGLFHIGCAYFQRFVLRVHEKDLGMAGPDHIQGVFFLSGAGHVVGSAVAVGFAYYFYSAGTRYPKWFRIATAIAALGQVLIADGKQVIFCFGIAYILLLLTKSTDFKDFFMKSAFAIVGFLLFQWCVQNVPAFRSYSTWNRPELYGPNGDATLLKTAAFRIVPTYYLSPLNWLLGLGPGHTVGRLGGWMLKEYASLLNPLGATTHPASSAVWAAVGASWLGDQSSMFSPLFGWAGIWGDLGILGLLTYLMLAWIVWTNLCCSDFSKLVLLATFIFGLIFSQLEEPGYMLTVAYLVGLGWHERRLSSISPYSQYSNPK